MTREEAIQVMQWFRRGIGLNDDLQRALDMAIEALSADAVSRDCETCKYNNHTWDTEPCDSCTMGGENNHYEAEAPKGDLISRQWVE